MIAHAEFRPIPIYCQYDRNGKEPAIVMADVNNLIIIEVDDFLKVELHSARRSLYFSILRCWMSHLSSTTILPIEIRDDLPRATITAIIVSLT